MTPVVHQMLVQCFCSQAHLCHSRFRFALQIGAAVENGRHCHSCCWDFWWLRCSSSRAHYGTVISSSATATVALGTVLRSNGRNLIRSTFMSAVRTALRAITRRVIRSILPTLLRLFLPAFRTSTQRSLEEIEAANPQPLPLAMGLGLVVLASSFYWVVELNSEVSIDQLSPGFSLFVFSLLAATTVIFHYSIMFWVGLKTNVTVSMRTSIDGILLQAYTWRTVLFAVGIDMGSPVSRR